MEGDDDWDGEYSDEDIDAEAEQIASGLWAELSKCEPAAPNPKEQAAVATVRAVLASLERDSVANATFAAAELEEASLLDVLQKIAESGTVTRAQALPLSRLLITLAKSDLLFGNLRLNKRKCEDPTEPPPKRHHTDDLLADVSDAVRVVSNTLTATQTLTPPVVASIQTHLQRLFHFAVSSASSAAADKKTALQEIGGLIQVLGVLSGIQFAQTEQHGGVAPCPAPGCTKLFARPSSLQSHSAKHAVASAAGAEADAAEGKEAEEEGEIPPSLVSRVQGVALEVHPLLQAHVSRALGGLPEADLARVQTQTQTQTAAAPGEEGDEEDQDAEGEPEDVIAA